MINVPRQRRLCVHCLCFLSVFVVLVSACAEKPPLVISQLHISELAPGQNTAAAYMSLQNNTDKTVVLNYVHSPIATHIQVHRVIYDQGMMQMREVKHLSVDPGKKVLFEPGGYHLMLMGIETPPKVGDAFDITLEFEAGYTIAGQAEVRSIQ